MVEIKITAYEAHEYSQALSDIICFLWGYTTNESNKGCNVYHTAMEEILEDLRKLRVKFNGLYEIKIEDREI